MPQPAGCMQPKKQKKKYTMTEASIEKEKSPSSYCVFSQKIKAGSEEAQ